MITWELVGFYYSLSSRRKKKKNLSKSREFPYKKKNTALDAVDRAAKECVTGHPIKRTGVC